MARKSWSKAKNNTKPPPGDTTIAAQDISDAPTTQEQQGVSTAVEPSAAEASSAARSKTPSTNAVTAFPPTLPMEGMTRQQRRFHKEKTRKEEAKEAKRLAEIAGVDIFPKDVLQASRQKILSNIESQLQGLAKLSEMSPSDALSAFSQQRRTLDDITAAIREALADSSLKSRRSEGKLMTAATISQEMTNFIKEGRTEDESDRSHLNFLSSKLAQTVCWENYKKFQSTLEKLMPEVEERKRVNARVVESAREVDKRNRAIERIRRMMLTKAADGNAVAAEASADTTADVISTACDLSYEASSVIFSIIIQRKLERHFCCVVEPLEGPNGGARGRAKGALVWGHPDRVATCVKFLKEANFSDSQTLQLDHAGAVAIIGRGGTGIRKTEEDNNCFIHINDSNLAVIYGMTDDVTRVIAEMKSIGATAEQFSQNSFLGTTARIARALQSLMYTDIRKIESGNGVHIRVQVGGGKSMRNQVKTGGSHVVISGNKQAADAARKSVESLVSRLVVEEVHAEPQAIIKLHSKHSENQLAEHFALLKEGSRVSWTREQENDSLIVMVGEKDDVEKAREQLSELLRKASFTSLRMMVARDQLRIFTSDVRRDIEMQTGIQFNVPKAGSTRDTAVIELIGDETCKATARDMVQIMLDTQASIQEFPYQMEVTSRQFLRQKAQRIHELEENFGVAISIMKESKKMRVLGPVDAVELCKAEILSLDQRNAEREKTMETKKITIEPFLRAAIIGRGGANLKRIKAETQIDRIDIKDSTVTVRGSAAAIAQAEVMILETMKAASDKSNFSSVDGSGSPVSPSTTAGGGGLVRKSAGENGGSPPRVPKQTKVQPPPELKSHKLFPLLDAAITAGPDRRSGSTRKNPSTGGAGDNLALSPAVKATDVAPESTPVSAEAAVVASAVSTPAVDTAVDADDEDAAGSTAVTDAPHSGDDDERHEKAAKEIIWSAATDSGEAKTPL